MSLDLNKLANKLDEALSNETSETLTKFLTDKRMSNNKQSSVEWLIDKLIEHQIIKVGQTTYGGKVNYKHEILLEQAKAMHKDEIINIVVWCDDTGRRPQQIKIEAEQYYTETYGGVDENN